MSLAEGSFAIGYSLFIYCHVYCRVLLDLLVCLDLLALLVADTTSPDMMSTELISQPSEPKTMKSMLPSSLSTVRLKTC